MKHTFHAMWKFGNLLNHTGTEMHKAGHHSTSLEELWFSHFKQNSKPIFETYLLCYLHRVVPLNTLTFHYPGQKNAARTKQPQLLSIF